LAWLVYRGSGVNETDLLLQRARGTGKKQKQADGIDSTFQCQSLKSAVRIIGKRKLHEF
jgi:hypothetical protein